ncbi:sugar phosphate isomerase/epimerase [Kribbella sp. NPDC026611]|uniref:sugar phosphate isomerase/epimerase family protein n=1 Tax=Kribbella sp. NPDC026611 TaxID=3154911 RepID=UPI003400D217
MTTAEAGLSVQLYTVRDAIREDLYGALARIARLGFTRVEAYDIVGHVDEYARAFDKYGLVPESAHAMMYGQDVAPIFEDAAALGVQTIIEPCVPAERWTTRADVSETARWLNQLASVAESYGLRLGYHNHYWEFDHTFDGSPALEVLASELDPAVILEVDTYWAAVGGQDVPSLLRRLGNRVQYLHVKDGDISRNSLAQTAVGSGRMPVLEVLAAAPQATRIVELDAFDGDVFEALADSATFLTANGDSL